MNGQDWQERAVAAEAALAAHVALTATLREALEEMVAIHDEAARNEADSLDARLIHQSVRSAFEYALRLQREALAVPAPASGRLLTAEQETHIVTLLERYVPSGFRDDDGVWHDDTVDGATRTYLLALLAPATGPTP